ncbi:MAG: asparagine synthase (glutamine-hydrolyzing) [Oscillospiraceae bacterium]|nr:asparagine synthase (glutamine-hydrolyzing) [Oscillospiraceae bacterium]
MCGFIGYIDDTTKAEDSQIKAMADKIVHRGPDQYGCYVEDGAALGFRRLSIIDLDGGAQPIENEDGGKTLVFNGEIYNFAELREELVNAGHVFKTNSDSEVILHGYEKYGRDLLNRLRGMFAFVIWDKKARRLFGARDIFGIKPLYYYQNGGTFLFGSEIKGFLAYPGFVKELNEKRLPDYLSFEYIPDRETLFQNVYKLLGGECFTYENGEMKIQRWFNFKYEIDGTKTLDEWAGIIAETFRDSTNAHKLADVEVGCFLSSGVDSSYTVHELHRRQKLKTFSVGYEEEKYSELPCAQEFARVEGVENYAVKISADDFFGIAPTVQYHMDEPLPNPSALPLYFLAKKASEHVKVVLSGEGADELFGGYNYYKEPLDYQKYMKVPQPVRTALSVAAGKLPKFRGKRFLVRGRYPIERRYIRNNYVFDYGERGQYLAREIESKDPAHYTKPHFDKARGLDDVTKMQFADLNTWLLYDILLKADKMSMASGLELRVPFLDREMLKTALAIPAEHRVQRDKTKVALRQAALASLPERTANMPKLGFPVPLNDWLREDKYYGLVKEKFESDTAKKYFNVPKIINLLDEHRQGKSANMKKVWSLYTFILWYEEYFVRR